MCFIVKFKYIVYTTLAVKMLLILIKTKQPKGKKQNGSFPKIKGKTSAVASGTLGQGAKLDMVTPDGTEVSGGPLLIFNHRYLFKGYLCLSIL